MHLDSHPLYVWDEGLFANRAFYWAYYGEYFTDWNQVDNCDLNHPNTKPPLISLIQAGFFKVLGYSRLALRLPIALIGLATCMAIIALFKNVFRNSVLGVLAALVLLLSTGYNVNHVLRSGEHDAAIAYFLLMSIFSVFMYVHSNKKNHVFLLLFFVFTGLGVLTKSIVGFFMVPPLVLYLILEKKLLITLKNKWTYIGLLVLLGMIFLFYGVMEIVEPGFLKLVWENEIGGRYSSAIDNHKEPWYYYIEYLWNGAFIPWLYFMPIGIFYVYKFGEYRLKKLMNILLLTSLFYLLIISYASTKLEWYAATIYPIWAIISALGIWAVFIKAIPFLINKVMVGVGKPVGVALLLIALAYPITMQIMTNYKPKLYWDVVQYEVALEKMRKQHPEIKKFRILTRNEWYPNLIFVVNKYERLYGYDLDIITSRNTLVDGEEVLGFWHPNIEEIGFKYQFGYDQVVFWKLGAEFKESDK